MDVPNPQPNRAWFQFSLRSLIAFMVMCSVGFGWLGYERQKVRDRRQAIEAIKKLGGRIQYANATRPVWFRKILGDDSDGEVVQVNLMNSRVADSDLRRLAELTNLKTLCLADTKITDAGLVHLTGLRKLECLYLHDTKITDDGMASLAGLSRLTFLSLDGTDVTDDGLLHLTGLVQLKVLALHRTNVMDADIEVVYFYGVKGRTKITDAGAQRLKEALPTLEIAR